MGSNSPYPTGRAERIIFDKGTKYAPLSLKDTISLSRSHNHNTGYYPAQLKNIAFHLGMLHFFIDV